MHALRFAGPFAFLAAIPLLHQISYAAPYAVPVTLLFAMLGAGLISRKVSYPEATANARLVPALYISLQLGVIIWGMFEAGDAGANALLSLGISIGVCSGVFGALAAHEMIHSRRGWHWSLGALMLTGISYRHFRIAHIYGHHRSAATERDPSTARLDESFYAFLVRTLISQVICAWSFEARRLRSRSFSFLRNRLARDIAIVGAMYACVMVLLGMRAAMFLALESCVAITVLELFNYVAHYGLERYPGESMGKHHSWNDSGAANLLLFNMGRHGDHHRSPSISYDTLRPTDGEPQLPGGYAGAIVLALAPPVWRKVMKRRLCALGAFRPESRYGARATAPAVAS